MHTYGKSPQRVGKSAPGTKRGLINRAMSKKQAPAKKSPQRKGHGY